MVKFSIDFQDEKYILNLKKLSKEIEDFNSVWGDIAEKVYQIEGATFEAEGKPKWTALSSKYSLWKQRNYSGKKILQLKGNLKGAATGRPQDTSVVAPIRLQSKDSLTIGIRGAYVNAHQNGTARMPQRKIYNFTRSNLAEFANIYSKHAKSATERIFGI